MDDQTEIPELQEVYLQERACEVSADSTLPAGQVLAEQSHDAQQEAAATRFIP